MYYFTEKPPLKTPDITPLILSMHPAKAAQLSCTNVPVFLSSRSDYRSCG